MYSMHNLMLIENFRTVYQNSYDLVLFTGQPLFPFEKYFTKFRNSIEFLFF